MTANVMPPRQGWAEVPHAPRLHYMRRPPGKLYADSACEAWRLLVPRFVPGEAVADALGTARIKDRRCCRVCFQKRQAELAGLRERRA